jgi:hypothetical protein
VAATPGCRAPESAQGNVPAIDGAADAAPTDLAAILATPLDIDLRWKDNATGEAGYFVEGYFGGPESGTSTEFFIISALPPDTTVFRHRRLLPETTFVYRVRAFFGGVSNVAEVTTGKKGPQQAPPPTASATREAVPSATTEIKKSLRSPSTAAEATPADLAATLIPPAGVRLEWKDRASDEDEYLVEIKPAGEAEFEVSAFLPGDATSMTSYDFPFETTFAFRVRAFFYGRASPVVSQTTGPDPSMGRPSPESPSLH